MIDRWIRFCLENRLVVVLITLFLVAWGVRVAPFERESAWLPRDPVPVDAIPDIGENQQIVFTEWEGRSPQDVEDQITYPLTSALLGVPGIKTIRGQSMFGFSSIFLIFDEKIEFYWARSRILEKLNSLPAGTLPEEVRPALGPDATALGQVFWYTLEGRGPDGRATGGWDLHELRSLQDWTVRYALQSVEGVAEVASVGGFVQEYQVDVDPDAMRAYGVTLDEVFEAVRASNVDVGARTIEVNRVEYVIRGLGFLENAEDLRDTVIRLTDDNVPVYVRNVAHVSLGPAERRGALDKEGAEAVGGVVTVRYDANPMEVIGRVHDKIRQIETGLPKRTMEDGTVSQVKVIPFYDRTGLIRETLGTLKHALIDQVIVTVLVVVLMLLHLRSSFLISLLLPLAILLCFIGMKQFGVDANIVALSGIAIAIGTIVDMGIILCENIFNHLKEAAPGERKRDVVFRASSEVGGAILTAVSTTVIGFLPVFFMTGEGGKLFRPLAYTKTFVLIASILIALTLIPTFAALLFSRGKEEKEGKSSLLRQGRFWLIGAIALATTFFLSRHWLPLGPARGDWNFLFVAVLVGGLLGGFLLFYRVYEPILRWCLRFKPVFLAIPLALIGLGGWIWTGLGEQFMPPLDEGSFLFMPSTQPHASIGESMDALRKQDIAISQIPEVESVVGKIGRVESPLDPAPIGMVETVILYKPEYRQDEGGRILRYRYDRAAGEFARNENGDLIPERGGRPYRNWREHIRSPDDIWEEIRKAGTVPGSSVPSKLQPIETRILMLSSGIRSRLAVQIRGSDLETIERFGIRVEERLQRVDAVRPETVTAERLVAKPYLEVDIDRKAAARHGIRVRDVQDVLETAVGGQNVTTTVEGRERYPVRVRYLRELRDDPDTLRRVLVPGRDGSQIPLEQISEIRYRPGPEMIKTEDTFLVGYVFFDIREGVGEVEAVAQCKRALSELDRPDGIVEVRFLGNYLKHLEARRTLAWILPMTLLVIFLILYMQFRSVLTTLWVFSGVGIAWAGGFLMLWLYGQDWFLNVGLFGVNLREVFQIGPILLTTAVWVGFLALFGIAVDDGVVMATYLQQSFDREKTESIEGIREAAVKAGLRRVRPCLMTSATTILALLPVLTSTGKGADVMIPMAIPSVGGMAIVMISMFVVPVLYCWREEVRFRGNKNGSE